MSRQRSGGGCRTTQHSRRQRLLLSGTAPTAQGPQVFATRQLASALHPHHLWLVNCNHPAVLCIGMSAGAAHALILQW